MFEFIHICFVSLSFIKSTRDPISWFPFARSGTTCPFTDDDDDNTRSIRSVLECSLMHCAVWARNATRYINFNCLSSFTNWDRNNATCGRAAIIRNGNSCCKEKCPLHVLMYCISIALQPHFHRACINPPSAAHSTEVMRMTSMGNLAVGK